MRLPKVRCKVKWCFIGQNKNNAAIVNRGMDYLKDCFNFYTAACVMLRLIFVI